MLGIHFTNLQWNAPPDDYYRLLALCRPATIKTCLFNQCGYDQIAVHRRLRAEHPDALIVARLMGNGFAASDYAALIGASVADVYEIGNEPNHPGEWSAGVGAWLAWFRATLATYRDWFPAARFVFPGMAVRYDIPGGFPQEWYAACRDAVNACDYAGVHCYWQHDNQASEQWGELYRYVRRLTPRPIIVTELGDDTPGRSATEKARLYVQWARKAGNEIVGSAVYILGGTPDWKRFELDEPACRVIGAREMPVSIATDGFDFPVGKPDGVGYYVAAGLVDEAYHRDNKAWHTGEDWNGTGGGDTDAGHQVYAVANGRVESVGTYPTWGKIVLIQHGDVWGQYAHLHEMLVKAGDVVRRGDVIGTIGHMVDAAGKPKGSAHLHFEIRRDKLPANQWNLSRDDVLRHYEAPSDYIRAHRPERKHLPEYEPASDVATLAQKARWWMEEEQRCRESGDDVRAGEIHESLIRLLYRVEAAAKGM